MGEACQNGRPAPIAPNLLARDFTAAAPTSSPILSKALLAGAAGNSDGAKAAVDALRALLPIWRTAPDVAVNRMLPDPKIAARIRRDLETAGLLLVR
jgi:hypothetical protein